MKVLIDIHPSSLEKSGIGRYCDNLTKSLLGLKKKDLNLSFYSNLPPRKLPSYYRKFPVYHFSFKHGLVRTLFALNRGVDALKPDILHATTLAPFLKKVPTILNVHDLCFLSHQKHYAFKTQIAFALFFERSLVNADGVIVTSELIKDRIIKLFPEVSSKISVIPLAADPIFGPVKDKERLKKTILAKFSLDKPYFLVVGNIEKRKNPVEIVEAFKKFSQKNKNYSLVFAGADKLGGLLRKKYPELIKKGSLRLLGYVKNEDLKLIYNGSVALVFFSRCEGFGLPLVEAFSSQTPVICKDIPIFREIAGEAALYCKSIGELSKNMAKLVKDKNLRNKLIRLGVQRNKRYSWEKVATKTYELYKKIYKNEP